MTNAAKELEVICISVTNLLRLAGIDAIPGDGVIHVRRPSDGVCAAVPLRWFLAKPDGIQHAATVALDREVETRKHGMNTGSAMSEWYFARVGGETT